MSKAKGGGITPQGVRSLQRALARVLSRCRSREDLCLVSQMLGGLSAIDEHCTVRNPGRNSAKVVYVLRGCDAGSQEASSVLYETPELASMDVTYAAAMACHEYITGRRKPVNLLARGPLPPIAHVCQCLESLAHAMLLYSEADKTDKSNAARGLSQDQLHAMLLSEGLPEHWLSRLPPESYVNWWWLVAWYQILLRISGSPGFCAVRYDHGSYKIDVGVRDANWQILNNFRNEWHPSAASLQNLTKWMAGVIASPAAWAHHDAGYAAQSLKRTHHRLSGNE